MFSSKCQLVLSFRIIDILLKMEIFLKIVLLAVVIVTSFCEKCDEDLVGFHKIGMHRKLKLIFEFFLEVTSALCNKTMLFCLISRLN